ncbi:MAG: hypothetical protein CMJ52_07440 [Planctomycetaceae bacterium]|nr:hypothetical protein [Planctomycetaceae bacterium]
MPDPERRIRRLLAIRASPSDHRPSHRNNRRVPARFSPERPASPLADGNDASTSAIQVIRRSKTSRPPRGGRRVSCHHSVRSLPGAVGTFGLQARDAAQDSPRGRPARDPDRR